jgi:signal transduction histidine kinase
MSHNAFTGWRCIFCAWMFAVATGFIPAAEREAADRSLVPRSESPLPILTTAEQVHLLSRQAAARGDRAVIRGVVTCSLPSSGAIVVQDATRGIYIDQLNTTLGDIPAVADLIEVEGVTDPGAFAPQVHARRLTRIGPGELPPPVRPTWDQLINGSLDSQFVEIQGVVTSVRSDGVTLLTHGGKIKAFLAGTNNVTWTQYENALVRVRACLFAAWDPNTHHVRVGEIRMFSPMVTVEERAPADVFAVPAKHAPELLLFDSQASGLRRVKVSGQIVYSVEGEFYMMDGASGLRFVPKDAASFEVGDIVEVVGFPSLTGPSPVLREAVARKIGAAPLPEARRLLADNLFQAEYDATRVRLDGVLLGVSADRQTLEMQSGLQRFLARVNGGTVNSSSRVRSSGLNRSKDIGAPVGSRLSLTGVYSGHGGNRTTGEEIGSFELLLNSPADILLLAYPPFWTLWRLLFLIGALVTVLIAALVWIRLLHHKVQSRTAQLQAEIREREHAEHQRVRAQERARIARDLHDDLGSSLTEITMLASFLPGLELQSDEASERLDTIAGKSRTLVHALDEIVWAVDPQRDTLASVARYLASYAEEYLAGLKMTCRVQIPNSFPEQVIPGEVRHHLFLAVKEALNNGVRHGGATEIEFRVRVMDDRVQISISDNGNGFDLSGRSNGHGLLNLRNRLENVSGRCEITSSPGAGTIVSLQLPLPVNETQL